MGDLRERVPAQSLIEKLLDEWDAGRIHPDPSGHIVVEEDARGWYDGVLGERQTALELALLGPEWTVLHSIPIGERGTDIDHLVIGPPGVFVINSKRHPGRTVTAGGMGMRINGDGVTHVRSISGQVAQVERILSQRCGFAVPVEGILSFVDVDRVVIKAPLGQGTGLGRIRAVRDSALVTALRGRREMSDEQVAKVVAAAALPSSWSRRPLPDRPGTHMVREFAALEAAAGPYLTPRESQRKAPSPRPAASPRTVWAPRQAAPPRVPRSRGAMRTPTPGPRIARSILGLGVAFVVMVVGFAVLPSIVMAYFQGLSHTVVAPTPAPTVSVTPTTTPPPAP